MIKIEEESFGSSTKGDMIKMLTNFHDDDSVPEYLAGDFNIPEEIPQYGTS